MLSPEPLENFFGFTLKDVKDLVSKRQGSVSLDSLRSWYDGYLFGDREIYNPWSIIKYVDDISSGKQFPEPYWANTSSNDIIKDMVYNADDDMKQELDRLISGGTIEKRIHEDMTYVDIHENEDNLWNFLFFTGLYLTGILKAWRIIWAVSLKKP